MTKEAYSNRSYEYRITSDIYFESPYIYVSSYYKTSEWNSYNIVVLPQIILKMKDGKSVEAIIRDYAGILKLNEEIEFKSLGPYSLYVFNCNVKTSRALLELNVEIYQRDDVEYSEFNTYGDYDFWFMQQRLLNLLGQSDEFLSFVTRGKVRSSESKYNYIEI